MENTLSCFCVAISDASGGQVRYSYQKTINVFSTDRLDISLLFNNDEMNLNILLTDIKFESEKLSNGIFLQL